MTLISQATSQVDVILKLLAAFCAHCNMVTSDIERCNSGDGFATMYRVRVKNQQAEVPAESTVAAYVIHLRKRVPRSPQVQCYEGPELEQNGRDHFDDLHSELRKLAILGEGLRPASRMELNVRQVELKDWIGHFPKRRWRSISIILSEVDRQIDLWREFRTKLRNEVSPFDRLVAKSRDSGERNTLWVFPALLCLMKNPDLDNATLAKSEFVNRNPAQLLESRKPIFSKAAKLVREKKYSAEQLIEEMRDEFEKLILKNNADVDEIFRLFLESEL